MEGDTYESSRRHQRGNFMYLRGTSKQKQEVIKALSEPLVIWRGSSRSHRGGGGRKISPAEQANLRYVQLPNEIIQLALIKGKFVLIQKRSHFHICAESPRLEEFKLTVHKRKQKTTILAL